MFAATSASAASLPIASEEVATLLARLDHAYQGWRSRSISERAVPMGTAARLLRERARQYARLMAEKMGKPIAEGIAECQKCATTCGYYAQNAERFLAPEVGSTDAQYQEHPDRGRARGPVAARL